MKTRGVRRPSQPTILGDFKHTDAAEVTLEFQRRAFLGTLGAGALAGSLDARAAASSTAGGRWDMSWVDRLTRVHRAVFDSTALDGGAGLFRAVRWKQDYHEVYGTAPEDMNAVLVVRAKAIWLAMNDEFWQTYKVGEGLGLKAREPGKFRTTNPILASPPDAPPTFSEMTLSNFQASGGIVLACHLAFGEVIGIVKTTDKLATDEEAEKKARSFMLPGVVMQPSGVFAALRAQEAGWHYILAN